MAIRDGVEPGVDPLLMLCVALKMLFKDLQLIDNPDHLTADFDLKLFGSMLKYGTSLLERYEWR